MFTFKSKLTVEMSSTDSTETADLSDSEAEILERQRDIERARYMKILYDPDTPKSAVRKSCLKPIKPQKLEKADQQNVHLVTSAEAMDTSHQEGFLSGHFLDDESKKVRMQSTND